MEFFDWMNSVQQIGQVIVSYMTNDFEPDVQKGVEMLLQSMYIGVYVGLALFLIELILGGIGIYKIAKKAGIAHPYLGFIPFVNTWYAGKIAGEARFFGQKMKRAGLYAMIIEILYSALVCFFMVLRFLIVKPENFSLKYEIRPDGTSIPYIGMDPTKLSPGSVWMYNCCEYGSLVANLLWFLMIVFFMVTYIAFFRKYYAKNPVIMALLCSFLPFRGFVLFAVRNNPPVDYNEYMRRRAEEYARRTYGGGGYMGPNSGEPQPPQEDPFPGFGKKGGADDDPFSDL